MWMSENECRLSWHNPFLQDAVPPIGFAIICRQQHMIKFLLEVENYDKSIYGVSHVIISFAKHELYQLTSANIPLVQCCFSIGFVLLVKLP